MERGPNHKAAVGVDVLIVGGGPAGTSAAIQAAKAGLNVVLLERSSQGRDRPGETLHPGVEPLFAQLGVRDEVLSAGFLRHEGHWVNWSGTPRFDRFGSDARGEWRGFQVWRADFDDILLRHSQRVGVQVRRNCDVLRPLVENRRVTGVATADGTIRSRVVIDASGSRQWLARRLRLPIIKASPKLIVRYGYAMHPMLPLEAAPILIADKRGWTWTAPVRCDLSAWTRLSLDHDKLATDWLPQTLRGLQSKGRMGAADVTWRMPAAPAGAGYFLIGDAASVLDPASSRGVLKAMMSGMMASHLIIQCARHRVDEATTSQVYNRWIQRWFEHDTTRLKKLYSIFSRGEDWLDPNATTASL